MRRLRELGEAVWFFFFYHVMGEPGGNLYDNAGVLRMI